MTGMAGTGARAASLALIAVAAGGCLPTAATTEGRRVAELYGIFMAIAGMVAVVVIGLTVFAIVRYRARPGDVRLPRQVHGNLRYEAVWTGIPIATIIGLLVLTVLVLGAFEDAVRASAAVELRVTAFRWGWRFEYPAEGVTVEGFTPGGPEVHVPVDENVKVTLTGADVIHAFFVPEFLFKRDAIPGRVTEFAFTVEEPGTYRGQCAEFCGLHHARMPFTVVAEPRTDYEAWLAGQQAGSVGAANP